MFKRLESSDAYSTSDAATGVTEKPGDLGEIAYPQTDPMYAEEALINKMAKATEPKQDDPKPQVASPTLKKALKQGKSKPSKATTPATSKVPETPPEPTQDDDTGEPTFKPLTVNEQGVEVNEAVVKHHGEDFPTVDTPGETDILDILDQHEKDLRGPDMSDEDRQTAAGIDFDKAEEEGQEIWSGDGPGGKGELAFFKNPDGGDPLGFLIYSDGSIQVVTGMLFPPTQ